MPYELVLDGETRDLGDVRYLLSPKTGRAKLTTMCVVVAIIVGLLVNPAATLLVLAYSFVATAPLGVLTAPIRSKIWGPETVVPPRTRLRSVFLPMVDVAPFG